MLLCYLYLTERRCNKCKTKNAKECGMESRMNRGWMKKSFLPVAAGMVLLTACGAETPGAEIIQSSESIEAGTSAGESTENVSDSQKQPLTEKEKRDEKEWEQLLDYTAERQAELAEIVVDLSEESEEIQAMGQNDIESPGQKGRPGWQWKWLLLRNGWKPCFRGFSSDSATIHGRKAVRAEALR